MNGVPGVVELGDTNATAGFELVTRMVVPPVGDGAPREPLVFSCNPAPTVTLEIDSTGAEMVTVADAEGSVTNPGMVADTVVVPAPSGSSATPPDRTLAGERAWPGPIFTVAVRVCWPSVTSCPTAESLVVTVAVTPGPPARMFCSTLMNCCVPLGIVSIVYAAQVNARLSAGDLAGAMDSSRKARTWLIVSVVSGGLLAVLYAIATILGATASQ